MSLQLVHDAQRPAEARPDRLIRLREVLQIAGVGETTWLQMIRQGTAPKGVLLTPRCRVWSLNSVLSWVQERLQAADGPIQ